MSDAEAGFAQHRDLLFSVAYRILGSVADAEDTVQDAWLRWSASDRSQVLDPKAYLARIATNLAVDRLRAAQQRRETYVGPWLPEPILTAGAEDAEAAESVSLAMLVLLESLSPLERAVFVLKEVFDFSYQEIADALDRSEPAVRQLGHRARGHVHARRPRFHNDAAHTAAATERFLAAAIGGDINALMETLAPDVTLWTDGGGKVRQALRPIHGSSNVAAWFAGVSRKTWQGVTIAEVDIVPAEINGGPGVLFRAGGNVIAAITVALDDEGRINAIHTVANPEKLHAVNSGRPRNIGSHQAPAEHRARRAPMVREG